MTSPPITDSFVWEFSQKIDSKIFRSSVRLLQFFCTLLAQTCTRVSTRIQVQLFGRKLLPFISPRSVEQKRVGVDAPPLGMLPDDFRGCPWYPSASGFGHCFEWTVLRGPNLHQKYTSWLVNLKAPASYCTNCNWWFNNSSLGGSNSNIFYFSPRKLGKMNPFWLIFFKGVENTHYK